MAEFITITPKVGPRIYLNLERITRYFVNSAGDQATVCFDMDSVEIRDRETVQQFLAGVRDPRNMTVRHRLVNLIGELLLEQNDGHIDNIPGLSHAIAHIQKVVDAL